MLHYDLALRGNVCRSFLLNTRAEGFKLLCLIVSSYDLLVNK